jgi:hypothetical protein
MRSGHKYGRKKINAFLHFFVILFGRLQIPLYRRSMIADPVSKEIDSEILFRHWHFLWSARLHKGCPLHSTPYVLLILCNGSVV